MPANDPILDVTVQTTRGTRAFPFAKTTKVSEVIRHVIEAFGFAGGDTFSLVLATDPGTPLQPERPLVSYGIEDGAVLILTSVGSGV